MAAAAISCGTDGYARRRPEETVLYEVIAEHWPRFAARAEEQGGLPKFVMSEFRAPWAWRARPARSPSRWVASTSTRALRSRVATGVASSVWCAIWRVRRSRQTAWSCTKTAASALARGAVERWDPLNPARAARLPCPALRPHPAAALSPGEVSRRARREREGGLEHRPEGRPEARARAAARAPLRVRAKPAGAAATVPLAPPLAVAAPAGVRGRHPHLPTMPGDDAPGGNRHRAQSDRAHPRERPGCRSRGVPGAPCPRSGALSRPWPARLPVRLSPVSARPRADDGTAVSARPGCAELMAPSGGSHGGCEVSRGGMSAPPALFGSPIPLRLDLITRSEHLSATHRAVATYRCSRERAWRRARHERACADANATRARRVSRDSGKSATNEAITRETTPRARGSATTICCTP